MLTLVDDSDFERLNQFHWFAQWDPNTKTYRAVRMPYINGRRILVIMAREIMGNPTGKIVDHINKDTLDNRRSNLRICSNQQNSFNSRTQSNNTSGQTGVHWRSSRSRWVVDFRISGKSRRLGSYKTKEDAIKRRIDCEKMFFGEFAPS